LKKGIQYLTVLILIIILTPVVQFAQVPPGVKEAFNKGNSQQLAKFFSKNIELLINQKEDVYSKAQAELILKDFFNKHHPEAFTIENQGCSDGINYVIGKLATSNGKFRIYFTYRLNSNIIYINRINITQYND
jgi:hypothetical protein